MSHQVPTRAVSSVAVITPITCKTPTAQVGACLPNRAHAPVPKVPTEDAAGSTGYSREPASAGFLQFASTEGDIDHKQLNTQVDFRW